MGGMGKGSSLAAVSAGSWTYNADDELSDETYDQDGNVTAADGKTFSYVRIPAEADHRSCVKPISDRVVQER